LAVALTEGFGFARQVERDAGLVGTQDFKSLLVERIEPANEVGVAIDAFEAFIEGAEQAVAIFKLFQREAGRQRDAADAEVVSRRRVAAGSGRGVRSAFDDERVVGGAEKTGLASRAIAKFAEGDVQGRRASSE
jgi:hypothetical protein